MPEYFYTAKSFKGEVQTGVLAAQNQSELAKLLHQDGYFLISATLEEKNAKKSRIAFSIPFLNRVSLADKLFFTRNLEVMVGAGISLPKFDGGIVTRLDCVPFGIAVNRSAKRFYDEGEDFWPKRYAIWGRLIAGQPDQIAYGIIDAKAMAHFMPSVFPPVGAGSISELAAALGLNPPALAAVVDEFNRAVRPGAFDPG